MRIVARGDQPERARRERSAANSERHDPDVRQRRARVIVRSSLRSARNALNPLFQVLQRHHG
jgi:hypothetical protein